MLVAPSPSRSYAQVGLTPSHHREDEGWKPFSSVEPFDHGKAKSIELNTMTEEE